MPDLLTYRGTVYPWQCDHIGHMNVMWYVGKFDEATWHLFAQIGLTPSYLRESGRGMAAVQQNISYKREFARRRHRRDPQPHSRATRQSAALRSRHDQRGERRDRSKLRADRRVPRSRRAQVNCVRGQGSRPGAEVDGFSQQRVLTIKLASAPSSSHARPCRR